MKQRRMIMNKRGRPPKLMNRTKTSGCVPEPVLNEIKALYDTNKQGQESFSEWFERETLTLGPTGWVMALPKQTSDWIHPSFFLTEDFWKALSQYAHLGYSKRSIILSGCYMLIEKYHK